MYHTNINIVTMNYSYFAFSNFCVIVRARNYLILTFLLFLFIISSGQEIRVFQFYR